MNPEKKGGKCRVTLRFTPPTPGILEAKTPPMFQSPGGKGGESPANRRKRKFSRRDAQAQRDLQPAKWGGRGRKEDLSSPIKERGGEDGGEGAKKESPPRGVFARGRRGDPANAFPKGKKGKKEWVFGL